ncbi:FAD-dependent NAD(P)-disulfide oxidoreductase [Paraburkholderia caribensis MBA4]|uniref:FAD-dependent NAD(P)-disulfide oxidoreductase n=1 Tax=Paraburkholderia caribensis MBA4 TaxID=1323664 RepID=A0A0P0RIR1_9BURK|nr:FAD-dependent oxidoreductase [Paraburkholderia caribensis]ALL68283.1 FAD-dependent NAD(P)-disulfide oxidoreductase [Paraburkholderia caribensis MBA4]
MSNVESFDVLILGSGQGGKLLAWHLGRLGKRVAVVERQWVGGSCPAVACLPSKNEIWSSRIAYLARHAGDVGTITGEITIDMAKVRDRKRAMVEQEKNLHLEMYSSSGAQLIMGSGEFIGHKTIEVQLNDGGTRQITGDQVVLNLGTHAAIPHVPGLVSAEPLTHIGALELDYAPEHLIVLGGGYIGIEMAQAYRRFGSRVTIVEHGPHLMGREDPDIAEEMQRIVAAEDIGVVLGAELVKVSGRSGDKVTLTVQTSGGERFIEGSDLLVATGRIPNTAGIGLEKTGVKLDARGYIQVSDRLQSSDPDIWAIGEAAGSPQFTHASVDDFRIVRDNLAGIERSKRDRLVPYTMFTDPPLAHVGLKERDAKDQGISVRVAKLPMSNVLRTMATDEKQGFLKVLVSADDDRIVGFTMIGAEAGEVLAVLQTAIIAGLPYQKLRDAVISHLTYAEAIGPLLSRIPERTTA